MELALTDVIPSSVTLVRLLTPRLESCWCVSRWAAFLVRAKPPPAVDAKGSEKVSEMADGRLRGDEESLCDLFCYCPQLRVEPPLILEVKRCAAGLRPFGPGRPLSKAGSRGRSPVEAWQLLPWKGSKIA